MNSIKLTVSKVSQTPSKRGNYIHTLKTEGNTVTVFGKEKKQGQLTYFLALTSPVPVGTVDNIDLDLFRVEEREFITPDEQTLMLKWLHIK